MVKNIAILGSTGSIGRQALEVVDQFPEEYQVVALAAGNNITLLAEQAKKYRPRYLAVASQEAAASLSLRLDNHKQEILAGNEGLVNVAGLDGIDLLLVAVSGINGLLPTLTALEKKTPVALANKETLVAGGKLVMQKVKAAQTPLIPVDSEHSAIFQCIEEENAKSVDKLLLTASGGPFLHLAPQELALVTPEMALRHPNWKMGAKITIDSAALINKGLEVIEAHWLYDVPYERIKVLIHPQSLIHSMVQYVDGSVLAQLGLPDMRVPIQYAFTYPYRYSNTFPKIDFYQIREMNFYAPDLLKFPGLPLAYQAGTIGGTMTAVYNAANEEAVRLFLQGKIKFTDIPALIEKTMEKHHSLSDFQVEDVLAIDQWARSLVAQKVYKS